MFNIQEKINSYSKEEKSAFILGGVFVHADEALENGEFEGMTVDEVMTGIIENAEPRVREVLGWDDSK